MLAAGRGVTVKLTGSGLCAGDGGGGNMAETVEEFFEALAEQGHERFLRRTKGVVRFELADAGRTDYWMVRVDAGRLQVSRGNTPADCVVRMDRALFGRIVRAEQNGLTAFLRSAAEVEGNIEMLVIFERVIGRLADERNGQLVARPVPDRQVAGERLMGDGVAGERAPEPVAAAGGPDS